MSEHLPISCGRSGSGDALQRDLDQTCEAATQQYNEARGLIRCPDARMSLNEAIRWLIGQLPTGNMLDLLARLTAVEAELRTAEAENERLKKNLSGLSDDLKLTQEKIADISAMLAS